MSFVYVRISKINVQIMSNLLIRKKLSQQRTLKARRRSIDQSIERSIERSSNRSIDPAIQHTALDRATTLECVPLSSTQRWIERPCPPSSTQRWIERDDSETVGALLIRFGSGSGSGSGAGSAGRAVRGTVRGSAPDPQADR